jgi:hypothetical protein
MDTNWQILIHLQIDWATTSTVMVKIIFIGIYRAGTLMMHGEIKQLPRMIQNSQPPALKEHGICNKNFFKKIKWLER